MRKSIVALALVSGLILLAPALIMSSTPARADQLIDYPVVSEAVTKGTSNGFQNEGAGDSVVNHKAEANNGTASLMLVPNGNPYHFMTTYGCTNVNSYLCVTNATEPDYNATFLYTSVAYISDEFTLTDPPLAADAIIMGVTVFMWARMNTTGTLMVYAVNDSGTGPMCTKGPLWEYTNIGPVWTNLSFSCPQEIWAPGSYSDWAVSDLYNMDIEFFPNSTGMVDVTYTGLVVTYQLPYWLDISEVINVPIEMVQQVEIFLSCSLAGDTEGFTMQINGVTAATDLCIAPNIDTRYVTDARGDVIIRTYSNPDPTQTTYSIDLLVARVTIIEGGDTSLKPPDPVCIYNAIFQTLDCVDVQSYYDLNVQWVRWQLDDGSTVKTVPNGKVSLFTGDSPFETGIRPHVVKATAVYLTGAEKSVEQTIHTDNGIRLIIFIGSGGFVVIALTLIYDKKKRRRAR